MSDIFSTKDGHGGEIGNVKPITEEVTPSMVAAGAEVLWESGLIEESRGLVERVVSEIYLAMLRAGRGP